MATKTPTLAEKCKQAAKPIEPQEKLAYDRRIVKLETEKEQLQAKYKAAMFEVESLEQQVETLTGLNNPRKVKAWSAPKRIKHSNATAILLLSDLHVEETVEPQSVNGLNEYNLDIADQSIKQTFDKFLLLLEDSRNLTNIRSAVVWLGGDMITGYLHPELEEANALAPLPACRWVGERIESGLRQILDHGDLDQLLVLTSYGNHGRTTHRPRYATGADNSYEQNLYLSLRNRIEHKRLSWQIGESYHNWADIQGYACRFHHGDAVKYHGGVGGLDIPMNKAVQAWDKSRKADFSFSGHFHQFKWNWRWLSNGSMIGFNAYSVQIKADFQPPVQSFAVIDRDRGMTRALPIFCR